MRSNSIIRRLVLAILFAAAAAAINFCSVHITGFASGYTRHVYPILVAIIGGIFGLLPFSAAEILLYLLVLSIVWFLLYRLVRLILHKDFALYDLGRSVGTLILTAAILFFSYTIGCGINYRSGTFSEEYGFSRDAFTTEELAAVCEKLTLELEKLSPQVERDAGGVMVAASDWRKEAQTVMQQLAQDYPALDVRYPKPKLLLIPEILSYQQVSGIYSPFTIEANVNSAMTPYNLPFTMCHELSHLSGYMREDEANFIAWLACRSSENVDFRYSAAMLAWIYCGNAYAKADADGYKELRSKLPAQVVADLQANHNFWARYDGKIAEAQTRANDHYLKAQGQADGVLTYDRFTELLVNIMK